MVENIKQEWKDEINITKQQWINLLKDSTIFTENDIELLKLIYASENYMATASQIAEVLNMDHYVPLNSQVGRLGKRIANKLNIEAPKQKIGDEYNWFNVPFWGIQNDEGYYWILRPELKEALEELNDKDELDLLEEVTLPDEINENEIKKLKEGVKKQVIVNRYERNPIARKRCIDYYGSRCHVCNFKFEKIYGKIGKGVIHVHHLTPISDIGEKYEIDPIKDLRPVCPNCHLIIHKKTPPYSIEEIKIMIKNNS